MRAIFVEYIDDPSSLDRMPIESIPSLVREDRLKLLAPNTGNKRRSNIHAERFEMFALHGVVIVKSC